MSENKLRTSVSQLAADVKVIEQQAVVPSAVKVAAYRDGSAQNECWSEE